MCSNIFMFVFLKTKTMSISSTFGVVQTSLDQKEVCHEECVCSLIVILVKSQLSRKINKFLPKTMLKVSFRNCWLVDLGYSNESYMKILYKRFIENIKTKETLCILLHVSFLFSVAKDLVLCGRTGKV